MPRMALTATIIVALFAIPGAAYAAGDVAAGKTKSATCVACHGANGQGVPPNPPLAGKPEAASAGAKGLQIGQPCQSDHEGDRRFAQRPGHGKSVRLLFVA